MPSAPGRPSARRRAGGLRRVLDDGQAERLDLRHGRDVAEQVHRDDRLRARRERRAHGLGRHAEGLRVDVAEDGPGAGGRDRLGAGVEGEAGHDHVVAGADAERAQRDRERLGAVGHADRVGHAEVPRRARASKAATSGPRMNAPLSSTRSTAARRSARSGSSGVLGSKSGTGTGGRLSPWPEGPQPLPCAAASCRQRSCPSPRSPTRSSSSPRTSWAISGSSGSSS